MFWERLPTFTHSEQLPKPPSPLPCAANSHSFRWEIKLLNCTLSMWAAWQQQLSIIATIYWPHILFSPNWPRNLVSTDLCAVFDPFIWLIVQSTINISCSSWRCINYYRDEYNPAESSTQCSKATASRVLLRHHPITLLEHRLLQWNHDVSIEIMTPSFWKW